MSILKSHQRLRALAFTSAACVTSALMFGAATLFANAAHADEKVATAVQRAATTSARADRASVDRGRYLAQIAGCNDCHTVGYAESGGKVPVSEWLTGVPVGYKGPWGTSYAANLRLTVQQMSEEQWLSYSRAERLPPMPWFALRDMSDNDLRSLYRFMRSLGPKGQRTPAPIAPGAPAMTPFILFQPQLEQVAAAR